MAVAMKVLRPACAPAESPAFAALRIVFDSAVSSAFFTLASPEIGERNAPER